MTPLRRIAGLIVAGLAVVALARGVPSTRTPWATPLLAQVRDAFAPPPTGNAVIAGTVATDDDAQRPVKRALVSLSGSELRGQRMAITNDAGHFELPELPEGAYTVTVSKPGYVTTYYGSRHPGRAPGTPIALANGQRRDLAVREMRGAVVTGTITDTFGRGVPDVRVSVLELRNIGGDRRLANVSTNGPNNLGTDEHGVYRIWGLPPGSYIISATPNSLPTGMSVREITSTDMEWVQQQLAAGNHGPMTPAPDAGRAVGYSTVYYPGVVDAGSAPQIEIKPAEERGGLSFSLQLVPTATVAGTVLGLDGQPVTTGSQVQLSQGGPSTTGGIALAQFSSRGVPVDRTGHFSLAGVAPGVYMLTARGSSRPPGQAPPPPPPPPFPVVGGSIGGIGLPPPPPPGMNDLWASAEVAVSGSDQTGLVLALRPGMNMTGRVAFEGAAKVPEDLTRVRIGLNVLTNDGLAGNVNSRPAAANGTFSVPGLTPGRYRPNATITNAPSTPGSAPMPPGPNPWRLKSAMWQGRDLLDVPLDVRPNEDVSDVTFVFTDLTSELSGNLFNGTGGPALGYFVIVFPVDQTLWIPNGRRIRQAQPTADGSFKLTNLPAGTYFMGAVTDLEPSDLSDPSFLEQLSTASLKIVMTDGGKVVQNLRLRDPG